MPQQDRTTTPRNDLPAFTASDFVVDTPDDPDAPAPVSVTAEGRAYVEGWEDGRASGEKGGAR